MLANEGGGLFHAQVALPGSDEADIDNEGGEDSDFTLQRVVATANYNLGPGIDLDGAIGYTWQDVSGPDFDESADNYDAIEIGIGTAITF